jgi:hypothetical protein
MTDQAPAIFVALEGSAFAAAIRQSLWLYPLANIGHVVALTCFAGAVAVLDLRLLGAFAATSPGRVIGRARRVAIVAFVVLATTGFLLFSAEASHVSINPVFQFKVALIVTGLANIAIYEFATRRSVEALSPGVPMPATARMAGMVSLTLWLVVAACGRSIAYF